MHMLRHKHRDTTDKPSVWTMTVLVQADLDLLNT